MIYDLVIDDPEATPVLHWEKVPFLSEVKSISFRPGLNILFGQNGTGKSTIIEGMARLLHCREMNWPVVTRHSVSLFARSDGILATGLRLEHDGQPARYLGIEPAAIVPDAKATEKITIVMQEGRATRGRAATKMSSGQASVAKLIRFLKHDAVKTRYKLKTSDVGPAMKATWDAAVASVKGGKHVAGTPKQQIVLLDEVDHNLDFAHQAMVWKTLRALVDEGKHQVIIASHSPFAVNVPGAHYIETSPGYLDAARKALRMLHEDDDESVESVKVRRKAG